LLLKISNITNLQDARYCAAMGFDLLSFNLERGNPRKLEGPMIWNLASWLEGVRYVVETNAESIEEVQKMGESIDLAFISLPLESWTPKLTEKYPSIILRAGIDHHPVKLVDTINKARSQHQEIKLELLLSTLEEVDAYSDLAPHAFFNLPGIQEVVQLVETPEFNPYGFSFRAEVEEGVGMLNYDLLDSFLTRIGRGNEQVQDSLKKGG